MRRTGIQDQSQGNDQWGWHTVNDLTQTSRDARSTPWQGDTKLRQQATGEVDTLGAGALHTVERQRELRRQNRELDKSDNENC